MDDCVYKQLFENVVSFPRIIGVHGHVYGEVEFAVSNSLSVVIGKREKLAFLKWPQA